jgi:hypothetical protein
MLSQVFKIAKSAMVVVALLTLQRSGVGLATPETGREPVPDYLAWRMFHKSTAFFHEQAARKLATQPSSAGQRTLFARTPRRNAFEITLKRRFGLTPDETAALLSAGKAFLSGLDGIHQDAKAEVRRRYKSPQALTAQAQGPRKTLLERSKEDGLHAEIEGRREAALNAHLQSLSKILTPSELAKVTQWVRTSVAPNISIMTSNRLVRDRQPRGYVREQQPERR